MSDWGQGKDCAIDSDDVTTLLGDGTEPPTWMSVRRTVRRPRGARGGGARPLRTKGTYLSAQYVRLRPRRGHKKALGAVKHSIIVSCWHMLQTGELYSDLAGDYFERRDPQKATKRLVAQLERLGQRVTLEPAAA